MFLLCTATQAYSGVSPCSTTDLLTLHKLPFTPLHHLHRSVWFGRVYYVGPCKTGSRSRSESTIYFQFSRKLTPLRVVILLSSPQICKDWTKNAVFRWKILYIAVSAKKNGNSAATHAR